MDALIQKLKTYGIIYLEVIKIKGKVLYGNANYPSFFALETSKDLYIIIEVLNGEVLGHDILTWNDSEEFYNLTQECEISAIIQWREASLQETFERMESIRG